MRVPHFLPALIGVALACGAAAPASAQDRATVERLDRLERDMNLMQRQVYRGGSGSAPMAVTAPGGSAVDTELRMDQIENQMRTLTGQIEELNYSIDQLKQRLDRFSGDVDVRFKELEGGKGGDPVAAASGAAAAAPVPGRAASSAPVGGARDNVMALPSGRGGQAAPPVLPTPAQPPAQQSAAVDPGTLGGGGSAQDQYNQAFGLLRQADYPAAEKALRSFLQRYPNDPLAGNAQYWLGETYYVRGDYNNAAAAFAEGYRKYPQGGKGPDSLLKLAMALGNVGQKREACLTLVQLDRDFPKASANLTERAKSERQRLECEKAR